MGDQSFLPCESGTWTRSGSLAIAFLVIVFCLGFPSDPAQALSAETGAILHWDTLIIGGINADIAFDSDYPFASADNHVDPEVLNSSIGLVEGESHSAFADVAGAHGIGRTYSTGLEGYALAERAGEADPLHHVATGSGQRALLVTPLELGTMSFSFNYYSDIHLVTDKPGDESHGSSHYQFAVYSQTTELLLLDNYYVYFETVKDGQDFGPVSKTGSHTFSYTFTSRDPVRIDLEANVWSEIKSIASIPEPSSLLLLVSGVVWLAVYKKQRFEGEKE